MPASPRVTVRDIARAADLHFTTVSLALRNSPRLKLETREKIQKLAQEMGYRPDAMLSALNAYRQSRQPVHFQASLAWIHQWPDPRNLYNCEEFNQYYKGAKERAWERGYSVEEFWLLQPGMNVEKLHRILKARNIQGVLLAPNPAPGQFMDLRYEELSAVAFGYSMHPAVLHLVTNHHVHTMNQILQRALEAGYRRPGLCIPKDWNAKVECAWQSAFLFFLEQHPEVARLPIYWETYIKEDLLGWVGEHSPDLVISFTSSLDIMRAAGYDVPGDIAFASPFLNQGDTHLSGVYQNDLLIGYKAVDMVIDMLHRGETGIPSTPVRMLVEGIWYEGETMPPKRPATPSAKRRKTTPAKAPQLQVARS